MSMLKAACLILSLSLAGVKGFGQIPYSMGSGYKGDSTQSSLLVRQNKLNLDLLGLSYQRESPIGQRSTFLVRIGVLYGFIITSGQITERYSYALNPLLTIGTRYYYRVRSSDSPRKPRNRGNFVSLDAGAKLASIASRNLYSDPLIYLRPNWGIQRNVGGWGSFEFGLGIAIKYLPERPRGQSFGVSPNIHLQLGINL